MTNQQISGDLRTFIRDQIETVYRLEVLLLLHREQGRSFSAADIARELGFETEAPQEQLRALADLKLAVQSNTQEYQYHPANPRLGSLVDELAIKYSKQRVPILSLILTERPDRIRLFAEAFRLIKGND